MSILQDILENKKLEIERLRKILPLKSLREMAKERKDIRPFRDALRREPIAVIAEIKRASPSRGIIIENFDHIQLAKEFEQAGASALSVVTDSEFFKGSPHFLLDVRAVSNLPLLRKDFIIDEYQLYESFVLGADAVLLIVGALEPDRLEELYGIARMLDLDVLVETHTESEIALANDIGATIIGINNRDLNTFHVSLERSIELRPLIRKGAVAVSESGIRTKEDVEQLRRARFDAILIGEGLVQEGSLLREMIC